MNKNKDFNLPVLKTGGPSLTLPTFTVPVMTTLCVGRESDTVIVRS